MPLTQRNRNRNGLAVGSGGPQERGKIDPPPSEAEFPGDGSREGGQVLASGLLRDWG